MSQRKVEHLILEIPSTLFLFSGTSLIAGTDVSGTVAGVGETTTGFSAATFALGVT